MTVILYCKNDALCSYIMYIISVQQFVMKFRCSVSCQFSDIGSYNQLSNEQKWSKSKQKWSVSKQTHLFVRNVP